VNRTVGKHQIDGVNHEFSVIDGIREDVITILLNLKRLAIRLDGNEPQILTLKVKGEKEITGADIKAPGQVEILNPELVIAHLVGKNAELSMEITVERGLGFVQKEVHQKGKVSIGSVALDAIFTPIRRVNYEVEQMRVGERTDFNRLRIFIETNGTLTPKEALERSIEIMINQLKAIIGFKEEEIVAPTDSTPEKQPESVSEDVMKTRIESIELSSRTANALTNANIRTVGGLARKAEADLLEVDGLGSKGLQEIKKALAKLGVTLKSE